MWVFSVRRLRAELQRRGPLHAHGYGRSTSVKIERSERVILKDSMSWKSTTLFGGIKCFGRYFFRHRHVFIIYILCLKVRLLWWSFVGENDSGRGYRWSLEWPDNFVWLFIIVVNVWLFSVRILTKTSCVLGMKFRQCKQLKLAKEKAGRQTLFEEISFRLNCTLMETPISIKNHVLNAVNVVGLKAGSNNKKLCACFSHYWM